MVLYVSRMLHDVECILQKYAKVGFEALTPVVFCCTGMPGMDLQVTRVRTESKVHPCRATRKELWVFVNDLYSPGDKRADWSLQTKCIG